MFLHVYAGNLFGGIETHLKCLLEADRQRAHQAVIPESHTLALCFEGQLATDLKSNGIVTHNLGAVRFRYPWSIARARNRIRKILSQKTFEAVIAHASWAYRLAHPAALKAGVPIVFWNHDILKKSENRFERYAARHTPEIVIANSFFTSQSAAALFGRQVDQVIYPLSQLKSVSEPDEVRGRIRRELGTPQDHAVIVQFCRFEKWKGHELNLAALAKIQDIPQWTAWFVGGVQKPAELRFQNELIEQSKSLGIYDRIRFVGHRTDIPEILCASDIHCQPNLEPEPFGLAFVEALSAGLPSVSVNFGGAAEILTPECGSLVDPGDVEGLSRVLERLILHSGIRKKLGTHGIFRATQLMDSSRALALLEDTIRTAKRDK